MDYNEIIQKIQDTEIILVGIGEELAFPYQKEEKEIIWEKILEYKTNLEKGLWNEEERKYLEIYKKLEQILKGKDYFILTTNIDAIIFYSELQKERIAAPCGDIRRLQCSDSSHGVWELEERCCPICGKQGIFNIIQEKPYNEMGYQVQWESYKRWLQKTINKKILLLELGEGFQTPTVIRWAFEKIAFINQKAYFYRVNEKFPQISAELNGKAQGIKENTKDFILSISELLNEGKYDKMSKKGRNEVK